MDHGNIGLYYNRAYIGIYMDNGHMGLYYTRVYLGFTVWVKAVKTSLSFA